MKRFLNRTNIVGLILLMSLIPNYGCTSKYFQKRFELKRFHFCDGRYLCYTFCKREYPFTRKCFGKIETEKIDITIPENFDLLIRHGFVAIKESRI